MKRVVTLLCFAALCLFMGFSTMAQSLVGGNLIGTVLDADGKAVVGASVTVTDSTTNQSFPEVKTGEGGKFAINDVPPGHYKVTVTMTGFKMSVSNDVEIITQRTYDLPVKMEVGAATVEVQITAGQQLLETANTSLRHKRRSPDEISPIFHWYRAAH